ncbi:cytochrome P450 [Mycena capillaripes]|nr:cytochrome P450 [Mycena capillaripes]
MTDATLLGGLAVIVCFLALHTGKRLSIRRKLPPGPNRADVPPSFFWKTFRSWNQQYGPVISFYLGRNPVVVLGTFETAHDLLDKRGEIYSGRPRQIVGHEILSGGMRGIGMFYGRAIGAGSLFVVSIIFCVSYGRRVKTLSDDVVVKNMIIGEYFGKLHVPGKFLVESWPILLYLQRFLQWFRWEPEQHRKFDTEFYMLLMNDVKRELAENTAQPSMAAHSLSKQTEFGLTDVETAYALSAPWAAGVGTTIATIEVFLLAMILFPSVQKKAQDEIDSVVGQGRSPRFEDYDALPYVQALIKEVTRWRCIAPTGIPHATSKDDVYQGMFIPKGTTVYANIYAMTTDPETFPDPDEFRPERFLDTRLRNYSIPFGFGRRLCPGQHVALQTAFISIVRMLWTFHILPGLNEKGDPVIPSADNFTSGLVTGPAPFPCRFEPRHKSTAEIIHSEAEVADM